MSLETPNQLDSEKKFVKVLDRVFDIAPKINYHHRNKHHHIIPVQNDIAAKVVSDAGPTVFGIEAEIDYHHQSKHHDSVQIQNCINDGIETQNYQNNSVDRQTHEINESPTIAFPDTHFQHND